MTGAQDPAGGVVRSAARGVRPLSSLAVLAVLALAALTSAGCRGLAAQEPFPAPAWLEPPPPPREAPVVQPGALERATLDNGLHVLALEDRRYPYVTIGVTVRRGAGAEPVAQAGVSEFTAELMERGAGSRSALELAELVDSIGASLSVVAGWDSMSVTVGGLTRDLDTLFAVLADVVLRPRFDAGEVERVRAETLASFEQGKDDPATLLGWHRDAAVYAGHRYGLPFAGTPETVEPLDAAAARALHERYFVASNAIAFGVGDLDAADFERRLRAAFGSWRAGSPPSPGPWPALPAPPARRIVVVDKPDLVQANFAIAHEGIARSDERRIAAQLMNDVLGGGGFQSRLMQRLRAEAGLTYGIWSGFGMRRAPGPFLVQSFTRVPELRRAIDLTLAEVEGMRTRPPTEQELADARSLAVGRFALGLETPENVISALVDLDVHGLPSDSLDTFRSRVRAVTREEVEVLARELLHPERAAIVVVGPAEALVPLLEGLGPVEVRQP